MPQSSIERKRQRHFIDGAGFHAQTELLIPKRLNSQGDLVECPSLNIIEESIQATRSFGAFALDAYRNHSSTQACVVEERQCLHFNLFPLSGQSFSTVHCKALALGFMIVFWQREDEFDKSELLGGNMTT
jgi:hypothetical protein